MQLLVAVLVFQEACSDSTGEPVLLGRTSRAVTAWSHCSVNVNAGEVLLQHRIHVMNTGAGVGGGGYAALNSFCCLCKNCSNEG